MTWKIDGITGTPPLVSGSEDGKHILKIAHRESGVPWDFPITLNVLEQHPDVALIRAADRRGTTDGSPPYKKFLCYSFDGSRQLVTAYLIHTFSGPVVVGAWDSEKRGLLENVDMEHIDITPDRVPDRVVARHLERIAGRTLVRDGLRDMAEKCYFDMLWNVPPLYGIYNGSVPEIPTDEEKRLALAS